jgi:hypothetical protein
MDQGVTQEFLPVEIGPDDNIKVIRTPEFLQRWRIKNGKSN